MIEVFKTNVQHELQALTLLKVIHYTYHDYQANFDLEDCDKILRIKCESRNIIALPIIELLKDFGFTAAVLEDEIAPSLLAAALDR